MSISRKGYARTSQRKFVRRGGPEYPVPLPEPKPRQLNQESFTSGPRQRANSLPEPSAGTVILTRHRNASQVSFTITIPSWVPLKPRIRSHGDDANKTSFGARRGRGNLKKTDPYARVNHALRQKAGPNFHHHSPKNGRTDLYTLGTVYDLRPAPVKVETSEQPLRVEVSTSTG